ncbi:hypothetical protein [Marinobacter adhaerens]|uniref:hypothetical protein n=1 Tax=Marinobacter adhaerens TaxID=1033846 RepID=UPI001C59C0E0|nr:hypothetical protein [Marinobacter adhaerens]MBW3225390.1 hypothetical protein [Marinobacter adhaerens]
MDTLASLSDEIIAFLGGLIVLMAAAARFNKPRLLITELSPDGKVWHRYLKDILSWSPGRQSILLKPPRANTTAFRYRLYQIFYASIGILIYLLLLYQPDIRLQLHEIIGWFVVEGTPDISKAQPLVVAAFVVLILPNLPPLLWGDTAIRTWLYERALIPAQQLREINRLKMARYTPTQDLQEQVHKLALVEGFEKSDIEYDPDEPTTSSLWAKCMLMNEQLRRWEADDHYKTAFAALRNPVSDLRSVDEVKGVRRQLLSDALVCLRELRKPDVDKSDELVEREKVFRANCSILQKKYYTVMAGISLHSHYSDNERVRKFREIGFELEPEPSGPLPDANDMLILVIILCGLIVVPLSFKLGLVWATLIGAMIFSAVISPVLLARFCPRLCDSATRRYAPNLVYPIASALLAVALGFLIFLAANQFPPPSQDCGAGFQRYLNCSYPWSIMHAGIALLLAIRLSRGEYPDVRNLFGWRRYRQWGNFIDAMHCGIGAALIAAIIVLPLLESLQPDRNRIVYLPATTEEFLFWRITLRMALLGFVLGFFVPTWYRAHKSPYGEGDRRQNPRQRECFEQDLLRLKKKRARPRSGTDPAT